MEFHETSRHMHQEDNNYDQIRTAHSDRSGSFGVKVQVQGIQGHPYVVLNGKSSEPPAHRDVLFMDQQHRATNGQASSVQGPLMDYRSTRQMNISSLVPSSVNSPPSALLNSQRHPSLLRPCDIRSSAHSDLNQFSTNAPFHASNVMVKRARIPLPGAGKVSTKGHLNSREAAAESVPCRPSHIVCRLSVPYSDEDHRQSLQRIGRVRHRNQVNSEDRRRSQSAGTSSSGGSSRTSPVPARVQVVGKEASAAPALTAGRLSCNNSISKLRTVESIYTADIRTLTAAQFEGLKGLKNERLQEPRSGDIYRDLPRCFQQNGDHSKTERGVKAPPDILKGQQELLDQPDEDATKLVLFNYLKEGSVEDNEVIRQKVNLLFEKIQMFRSYAAQDVEEISRSEARVKDLQDKRAELGSHVTELKQHLEEEIKKRKNLSEKSEKITEELKKLQDNLSKSEQEQVSLRQRLTDIEKELQASLEEVLLLKRERERSRAEAKSLQQQLSDMHDELDNAKSSENQERDTVLQELVNLRMEFQDLQQVHEEQEEMLHWKERELIALKGALEEEILAHAQEVEMLKEQHKQEIQKLLKVTEDAKESITAVAQKKIEVEAEMKTSRAQIEELTLDKELLLGQIHSLETQITTLSNIIQQSKSQEKQLKERLNKLMEEKQLLEEEFSEVRQQEEDMCSANRALTRHLEDTQSEFTRLNQEHRQLKERLRDEERQVEELRQSKRELEQERRKQDKTFEELQEEIKAMLVGSESETQKLQDEVDKAKDHCSKERSALSIQLQNTETELNKHQQSADESQKKLCGLEAELAQREAEVEQAELKCKQLEMTVEELQESSKTTQNDRDRQVKLLEVRVTHLQEALAEEHSSGDDMMDKMEKMKEEVELVRADLLQEREVNQDLECDKISLERQNKDLKSRVFYLEGSQRSEREGLVSKLELRIQELEERLLEEERDKNTLQQANRKLERKIKEMTLQVNDEQLLLQNQRDQLTLRLKTLKRQLDEAEEEIERLENSKKKLQRELDEQQESNEELHSQLSVLRTELRRKNKPILNTLEDEEEEEH
ncbi:cingulin-like protein 1 isoform X1 [Trichomycterus rosablanca]|uniref:cingulin-like protein 1 isoform X1 n=1 Tax=Trichomycterus rosablanca TaxID=2290929 RepID=UPI002F351DA6